MEKTTGTGNRYVSYRGSGTPGTPGTRGGNYLNIQDCDKQL